MTMSTTRPPRPPAAILTARGLLLVHALRTVGALVLGLLALTPVGAPLRTMDMPAADQDGRSFLVVLVVLGMVIGLVAVLTWLADVALALGVLLQGHPQLRRPAILALVSSFSVLLIGSFAPGGEGWVSQAMFVLGILADLVVLAVDVAVVLLLIRGLVELQRGSPPQSQPSTRTASRSA